MIESHRDFLFCRGEYGVSLLGAISYLLLALIPARLLSEVAPPAPQRRALVIGIDHYVATDQRTGAGNLRRWRNLRGAVNDAEAMARLLEDRYGFDVALLIDESATRANILAAIESHLIKSAKAGDETVFFFAGHGSQVANSKSQELDKKDETLVPVDAARGQPDIRDKELRRLFNRVLDHGARLTVILDSCHSGSGIRGLPSERSARFLDPRSGDAADPVDPGPEIEDRDALILSAAQDFELALEMDDERGEAHGAFTLSLLRSLARASAGESASRLFRSARSRLRAEGFQQEPVIAGSVSRRAAPLFGGPVKEQRLSAAVLGVDDGGQVVLQGGWADGLSKGSVLRPVRETHKTAASRFRLRIVEVELTRSRARAETAGKPVKDASSVAVQPGDLFELEQWAVAGEASLQVRIPTINTPALRLLAFADRVRALADTLGVGWVEDPVAETPTHVLHWQSDLSRSGFRQGGGGWRLRTRQGGEQLFGAKLEIDDLRAALSGRGIRLFLHLPLPLDFRQKIRLEDGTTNDILATSSGAAEAVYVLTGRRRQGKLEYAWIRPGVSASDKATSSLPLQTRWVPYDGEAGKVAITGRILEDLASRLGRLRAWLTLDPPTTDLYPYRLALRRSDTKELKLGDHLVTPASPDAVVASGTGRKTAGNPHRNLAKGERYGLVLRAEPEDLERPFEPLYVYAFFLDSHGKSTLLYPRGQRGSVENRVPDTSGGPPPTEISIGRQPVLEMDEPYGADTYFLLVTSEPIQDPFVLAADGVRGPDSSSTDPLERLLRNRGTLGRSAPFSLTPTTWSIDRVSFVVVKSDHGHGEDSLADSVSFDPR